MNFWFVCVCIQMAEYAWASNIPGGQDAVAYLSGLRTVSLLFTLLSGGTDDQYKLYLIYLLRVSPSIPHLSRCICCMLLTDDGIKA